MGTLVSSDGPDTDQTLLRLGGQAPVLAVWGGIGFSRRPLKDLRDLYLLYQDELRDFLTHCSEILQLIVREHESIGVSSDVDSHSYGGGNRCADMDAQRVQRDLIGWLEDPSSRNSRKLPSISQAANTTVTTILQMARYVLLARRHSVTPGTLACHFTAFCGHSVGMTVAIGMASADSWASLYQQAEMVMRGTYLAECSATCAWDTDASTVLPTDVVSASMRRGEGRPTPMLSVTGVARARLLAEMDLVNQTTHPNRSLHLALINGIDSFVAAGGPEGLVHLSTRLQQLDDKDAVSCQFIASTAPFHSPYMGNATERFANQRNGSNFMNGIVYDMRQMLVPVWGLDDLLSKGTISGPIAPAAQIVDLIISQPVDWPRTMAPLSEHWQVLDFGPGGFNGIGISVHNMACRQTYIVYPAPAPPRLLISEQQTRYQRQYAHIPSPSPPTLSLVSPLATLQTTKNYARIKFEEAQGVTQTSSPPPPASPTKANIIRSKFTDIFGLPRVLVAGMTPTSCHVDFVAAAMRSGFYAEFATGGYNDGPTLAVALKKLSTLIPNGRLITVNIVYANPQGVRWIIPLLHELIVQGYPIGGLVIGAGVPDADVVAEYIDTLQLCHIGFKPANLEAIHQVLHIAEQHPALPFMLQWTGGRAGGHHSVEDFHQPILASYESIREVHNVILVAGSGFGDAAVSWPYISGSWSRSFGRAPMPFDAILIGTCATVTLESKLSFAAKQAIVDCTGLDDADWLNAASSSQGAGGIVSVVSHLGEPMHVVATRSTLLWAELDQRLFSKSKDVMLQTILDSRDELISQLNAHHQKVWFGWDYSAGRPATHIGDMTYADVLRRLLELTHPSHKGDWMHPSYQQVFQDFFIRTLERFNSSSQPSSVVKMALARPEEQLQALIQQVPACQYHLLAVEDVDFFIATCKRRERKPVPFVPVLDADLATWFKKDPLWEAENLESTHHRDVGRVCILAGPVATRYCHEANVPLSTFLRRIDEGIRHYEFKSEPRLTVLPSGRSSAMFFHNGTLSQDGKFPPQTTLVGNDTLVVDNDASVEDLDNERWLLLLSECLAPWGTIALGTRKLVSNGKAYINPIRRLFAVRPGVKARLLSSNQDNSTGGTSQSFWGVDMHVRAHDRVRLSIKKDTITAAITSSCTIDQKEQQFVLDFALSEVTPYAPLSEITDHRHSRLRDFYWSTLFGPSTQPEQRNPWSLEHAPMTVTVEHLIAWQRAVGGQGVDSDSAHQLGPADEIPIEFSTVVVMEATWRHLLSWDLDTSKLIHQHTTVSLREGQRMLCVGDHVFIRSQLVSLSNDAAGIEASISITCTRDGQEFIDLTYRFIFWGQQLPDSQTVKSTTPTWWTLQMRTEADVRALQAKPWFCPIADAKWIVGVGDKLLIKLNSSLSKNDEKEGLAPTTTIQGTVWAERDGARRPPPRVRMQPEAATANTENREGILCAYVHQVSPRNEQLDSLKAYLQRKATPTSTRVSLPSPKTLLVTSIRTPDNSVQYGAAIRDLNPIHTLPTFASLSGFTGPIYHGNHTAALVLQAIRQSVPQARAARLRHYDADFSAVVMPADTIHVTVKQVAMDHGNSVLAFTARRGEEAAGEPVLIGEVVVEAPPTAYLFTGQGSQFTGMGMALTRESLVSRRVWEEADEYFTNNWGFSLTNIVKSNPAKLTIHFSGVQGQHVRQNYLDAQAMLVSCDPGSSTELFAGLHTRSRSHTFRHPDGLLSMTQFAQPALVVFESAAVAHLQHLSRVPLNAAFAGHSLGEFAALTAMTRTLPLSVALQTVFIRGALMQAAVPRDENGRSEFGMTAIDPSRIAKGCSEDQVLYIVQTIAARTGLHVEVVNFNVHGRQYVAAGSKRCLEILRRVTDDLHGNPILSKHHIAELITRHTRTVGSASVNEMVVERGKSTVPLPGIDVPFHSTHMAQMAGFFRQTLVHALEQAAVEPQDLVDLVDRWIPNVVGKPFALNREYLELVLEHTGSSRIERLLGRMKQTED